MSIFRRIYSDLFNLNKDYALNYYGIQKINNEYNKINLKNAIHYTISNTSKKYIEIEIDINRLNLKNKDEINSIILSCKLADASFDLTNFKVVQICNEEYGNPDYESFLASNNIARIKRFANKTLEFELNNIVMTQILRFIISSEIELDFYTTNGDYGLMIDCSTGKKMPLKELYQFHDLSIMALLEKKDIEILFDLAIDKWQLFPFNLGCRIYKNENKLTYQLESQFKIEEYENKIIVNSFNEDIMLFELLENNVYYDSYGSGFKLEKSGSELVIYNDDVKYNFENNKLANINYYKNNLNIIQTYSYDENNRLVSIVDSREGKTLTIEYLPSEIVVNNLGIVSKIIIENDSISQILYNNRTYLFTITNNNINLGFLDTNESFKANYLLNGNEYYLNQIECYYDDKTICYNYEYDDKYCQITELRNNVLADKKRVYKYKNYTYGYIEDISYAPYETINLTNSLGMDKYFPVELIGSNNLDNYVNTNNGLNVILEYNYNLENTELNSYIGYFEMEFKDPIHYGQAEYSETKNLLFEVLDKDLNLLSPNSYVNGYYDDVAKKIKAYVYFDYQGKINDEIRLRINNKRYYGTYSNIKISLYKAIKTIQNTVLVLKNGIEIPLVNINFITNDGYESIINLTEKDVLYYFKNNIISFNDNKLLLPYDENIKININENLYSFNQIEKIKFLYNDGINKVEEVSYKNNELIINEKFNSTEIIYYYSNDKLLRVETKANNEIKAKNTYYYDAYGNLINIKNLNNETITNVYTYDIYGNIIKIADYTNTEEKTFVYDNNKIFMNSNLENLPLAQQHIIRYNYDINRLNVISFNGTNSCNIDYNYNEITKIKKNNLEYTYNYDNNVLKEVNILNGNKINYQLEYITINSKLYYKYIEQYNDKLKKISIYNTYKKLINSYQEDENGNKSNEVKYIYAEKFKDVSNITDCYSTDLNVNNDVVLRKVINGNNITNYEYDDFNRVINDGTNVYKYNNLGNVYEIHHENDIIKESKIIQEDLINNKWNYNINNHNLEIVEKNNFKGQNLGYKINNLNLEFDCTYAYDNNEKFYKVMYNSGEYYSMLFSSYNYIYRELSTDGQQDYEYNDRKELIKYIDNDTYISQYAYDDNGNIISKEKRLKADNSIIESKNYLYTNNKLVSYDNKIITYDKNGNIKSYDQNEYSYSSINKLVKVDKKSTNRIGILPLTVDNTTFTYDEKGLRTSKIYLKMNGYYIDKTEYSYKYIGNKLYEESRHIYFKNVKNDSTHPYYPEADTIDVYKYIYKGEELVGYCVNNENYYYYQKNVFGDIIGIYDSNKQVVAKYKYDPYGVCSITYDRYGAGNNNPFRYRGYYYDIETQLFYCNSRYYSPELCRWISPDSIEYLDPQSING